MPQDPFALASERKTLEMERSVSQIRAVVIGINVVAYFLFIGVHASRAPLALTVVGIAVPYAIWSLAARPYLRFPLLRFGALTLSTDIILITLWVLGTGGIHSEFWIIYVISVVSVAMRYDLRQTFFAAFVEALVYTVTMAIEGMRGISLAVRPSYVMIAGFAAGLLARMERVSREERVAVETLAAEHALMLGRERETVERLRQLDRLKSEFVASASHELRTPLTTLSGLAMMLADRRDEMTPDQLEECFAAMRRQGERARVLIENLLDLSKLEQTDGRPNAHLIKLTDVVGAALEIAPPPQDKDVRVRIESSLAATVDEQRLQQVLANLLVNAYRYGGAHITLTGAATDAETISVLVEDDGDGIPADDVPHLFEPFARGTNVNGAPGSGLGLTISARLMKALGGSLSYEPAIGGGTTFRVSLPRSA